MGFCVAAYVLAFFSWIPGFGFIFAILAVTFAVTAKRYYEYITGFVNFALIAGWLSIIIHAGIFLLLFFASARYQQAAYYGIY